jgi:DNA gyrase subunit B
MAAHIRTLLLTFFYRQMPELIERGHVYIASRRCTRSSRARTRLYVKDDAALDAYLAGNAVEGAQLVPATGEPPIDGAALESLLLAYARAREAIARNAHRYDPQVLEALIDFAPVEAARFAQDADPAGALATLASRLNAAGWASRATRWISSPRPNSARRPCW